ncbi:MAG: hypothetical protein ACYDC5_00110 [Candidatus Dormibacteria bacterium]
MVRRSCATNCLGCLLLPLLLLAVLAFGVHQMTTPPPYPVVNPAPISAVQLAAASGLEEALSAQSPVALIRLNDAQATALLQQTLAGYAGLSQLQVNAYPGRVILSGATSILSHRIVISGPVKFSSGVGGNVKLTFDGLWIGQLGLPQLLPQLITRGLNPDLNTALVAPGHDLRFACYVAGQNSLTLGLQYTNQVDPTAATACAGPSS